MTTSRRLLGPIVGVLLLWAAPAAAQNCTIQTTTLNFGTYDVFATADTSSTATISIRCNRDLSITVFIDRGASTTFHERLMTGAADQIAYNLYLQATYGQVWGDGSESTTFHAGLAPRNANVDITVYGRVLAGQDVSAGAYSDTVVATVNY
jgi:spore coat protein U-like protein